MDPLYVQLAADLAQRIDQGLLRSGDRLPGVRELARQRGLSVATAVAAYRELETGGRIEARPRSGFYVRTRSALAIAEPEQSNPAPRPMPVTGQELVLRLAQVANDPAVVQLGAAVPDPTFLPTRAIERALASAAHHHRVSSSNYEFPPGLLALRHQLARRMAAAGARVQPDDIIITNGCQEALTLALQTVTKPGDVVALESPTFYGLLQVVEALGLKALEIPTHPRTGLSLEALQLVLEQWPVKACVAVTNFSNPLGHRMGEDQKRALVALTARYGVPLIEDDIYGDLAHNHQRPGTAKGYDQDGNVLYCSSVSKTLSPGLRVGWIAPGRFREQVLYRKYVTNLAAPTAPQLAVADLLESGRYDRHLRVMQGEFARAVQRMTAAIGQHFPPGTRITQPEGGFVLWVELPERVDSFELAGRALEAGISVAPGPIFSATGKYRNFLRLSCACRWDERTERALLQLGRLIAV
ncbi:MAG TPA: PLP-dependent aminotransferase family protein [Dongiaceae bacterium]|nr:PLP-dependent aminotransferase family protein [Dongiaceae bacterium]